MITIPVVLQNEFINFVLIEKGGKKPFQKDWPSKIIKFNDQELLAHIKNDGNYGVIGGGKKHLLIVDFDEQEIQDKLEKILPQTFTVKTGSGKHHLYYFSNGSKKFKIFDKKDNTLIDVQGDRTQAVGPNSKHPNGNFYKVFKNIPIAFIDYDKIYDLIMKYDEREDKVKAKVKKSSKSGKTVSSEFVKIIKSRVSFEKVLIEAGINTNYKNTNCCWHDSKGGKCFSWNSELWRCFHCERGGDILSFIQEKEGLSFKEVLVFIAKKYGLEKEFEECKKKYFKTVEESNLIVKESANTFNDWCLVNFDYCLKNKIKVCKFKFNTSANAMVSKKLFDFAPVKDINTFEELVEYVKLFNAKFLKNDNGFVVHPTSALKINCEKYCNPGLWNYIVFCNLFNKIKFLV